MPDQDIIIGKSSINDMQSKIEMVDVLAARLDITHLTPAEGVIGLEADKVYRGVFEGDLSFTLPKNLNNNNFNQILLQAKVLTDINVDFGTTKHFGDEVTSLSAGRYNIIYEHDGLYWVYGVLKIGG